MNSFQTHTTAWTDMSLRLLLPKSSKDESCDGGEKISTTSVMNRIARNTVST